MKTSFYLLLIFAGLFYSFFQHYTAPLDGDLVGVVLPTTTYQRVLEAPFGSSAVFGGERYAATNRYAVHQTMYLYFNSIPAFLQKIMAPVSSIYASAALFKLFLQVFLLWLFSTYITTFLARSDQRLIIVLILIPLFQHETYNGYIGLISGSITYTFFYTFPVALLLWFFLPYFKALTSKEKGLTTIKPWTLPIILFGVIYLSFSGPLIAPLVLLIGPLVIIKLILINYELNKPVVFDLRLLILLLFVFMALYAFYLGTFNLENSEEKSIIERFKLLPYGLFYQVTNRPAVPLLLLMIVGNIWWIKRREQTLVSLRIIKISKIILFFSMVYILMLPLGGYREYRPYILRMDTLMPVNFGLFILFGVSTMFIINNLKKERRKIYAGVLLVFSLIFLNANWSDFDRNACEKDALETIATANNHTVRLEEPCSVLSWEVILYPEKSISNARLLKRWNIIDTVKLYHYAGSKTK